SCTCSGSNHPTGCRCPSETTQLTGIPINQCECRSSADPRAGSTCPAYCVNGQVNSSCVCDSNNASFPYTTCEREKACSINLINQSNITCPCLSTGDPRAGLGQCPAYCVKGQTNTTCACDTGSTYYPVAQCRIDKLCITDLIHQSITDCPCMTQSDPRAGGICPQYCTSKAELSINCVCETGSSLYPQATCEKDKLCIVDLIHQSTANCPCLEFNDPRGESICKSSDPDPSDPIIPDPSEKDPETEQEQGSGSKQDDEKKTEKEESKTFNMIWIIFIVIGILAIAAIIIIELKDENDDDNQRSKENKSRTRSKSMTNQDRPTQNRTKTRNKVHSVKDDDEDSSSSSSESSNNNINHEIKDKKKQNSNKKSGKSRSHSIKDKKRSKSQKNQNRKTHDDDESESSSESSSSTSSSSSSSSSSTSASKSSSKQSNHQPVIKPHYKSDVLDQSFKSPSESHRGSINEADSESVASILTLGDLNEKSSIQSSDGGLDQSQASSSYLWDMYKQYMPSDQRSQSSVESINTRGRKDSESPITQNSISSFESKKQENQ
ncbi:MAG: hypothetical protein EZS28_030973, partial [Streblomastix strix]